MNTEKLNSCLLQALTAAGEANRLFGVNTKEFEVIINDLQKIKKRLSRDELRILIAGEAKVGKSSLINALLGIEVCPTEHRVCTNVPSYIKYGDSDEPSATVYFKLSQTGILPHPRQVTLDELQNYSSEVDNVRNEAAVDYIEIKVKNSMLETGLVLIDTPGLGALDPRHAVATFEAASQADIIFFLGNTDHPLTVFEVDSLKQLIECSGCNYVAHVLTCCDNGDAEAILASNKLELDKIKLERGIKSFGVSSLLYKQYCKNKKEAYLKRSGFLYAFSFIEKVKSDLRKIIEEKACRLLFTKVYAFNARILTIKETAGNPEQLEKILEIMRTNKARLQELYDNQNLWENKLRTQYLLLQNEIQRHVIVAEEAACSYIDQLLTNDIYLNDANKLGQAVMSKLFVCRNKVIEIMQQRMESIEDYMMSETRLQDIVESICFPSKSITSITISEASIMESNAERLARYGANTRNWFRCGLTIGSVVGGTIIANTAVAAKVGATVGIAAGPAGVAIGAAVGALTGIIAGISITIFQSKARKREKLSGEAKKSVHQYFENYKTLVRDSHAQNISNMIEGFKNRLDEAKHYCVSVTEQMTPIAVVARSNWNGINSINAKLDEACKLLEE